MTIEISPTSNGAGSVAPVGRTYASPDDLLTRLDDVRARRLSALALAETAAQRARELHDEAEAIERDAALLLRCNGGRALVRAGRVYAAATSRDGWRRVEASEPLPAHRAVMPPELIDDRAMGDLLAAHAALEPASHRSPEALAIHRLGVLPEGDLDTGGDWFPDPGRDNVNGGNEAPALPLPRRREVAG